MAGMATVAPDSRTFLKSAGQTSAARMADAMLLLDSVAAIGFAAGLAGCIVRVGSGWSAMLPWAALVALFGGLRGLFVMASARQGAKGAAEAKARTRRQITRAVLRRAPAVRATTGELVGAIVDEVEALDLYIARFLPARRAAALGPLIVLAATALASPISALILAGTLLPFILAMWLAGGAAADEQRRHFEALARLSGRFADRVRSLPVILAFGRETDEAEGIGRAADDLAARTMQVLRKAFLSSASLEFFAALSVALVAVYAGFNLLGLLPFPVPEKLTLARGFFVLALAPEFYAPMRRLAAAYHDKQAAEAVAERLQAHITDGPSRRERMRCDAPPRIEFRDVAIRFPGEDRPVIESFSLVVPPGRTVAIVGPSGAGKTSLLNLLLGLAPLAGGELLIDGRPLGHANVAAASAWAGQAPLLLPGTIWDNLLLANPDASRDAVENAVRLAGLAPMLAIREDGLLSQIDERGSGFSGGERRRLGLARAILKDAPLLLLDEPTAHLDLASETALLDAIAAACRGRTVLLTTHSARLAAIADQVVQL